MLLKYVSEQRFNSHINQKERGRKERALKLHRFQIIFSFKNMYEYLQLSDMPNQIIDLIKDWQIVMK